MSEELLQEETKAEASAEEMTMADLEEHFDDANPWNVVKDYMEKKTILPVKVEGIVNGYGRRSPWLYSSLQAVLILH